jgi:glycosyltransferase involved in cell wall biosynthesis
VPPIPSTDGIVVVSVVIPAYNAEKWLPLTLQSVSNQTLRAIEILVVDDGSSDGTWAVAQKHALLDPRVRLIQCKNGGVGAARNTAIREARGKYIAPLDADDLWSPEKLEAQVACMEAGGEEMGLVYCWSDKIDARGDRITSSYPFDIEGRVHRSLILRNYIGSGSVPLFRAAALEKVGLYLERSEQNGVQGCEDWDLSLRLAEHYRVGVVRRSLVGYRQAATCMSLNAAWMSRSYEVMMNRARSRNPGIEGKVFRWSAGNFYSYLVSKCYLWCDYRGCLRSIAKAVMADYMLVLNRRFYLMGMKSVVRLATGSRGRTPAAIPPGESPPVSSRSTSFTESIQSKRWKQAQHEDCVGFRS